MLVDMIKEANPPADKGQRRDALAFLSSPPEGTSTATCQKGRPKKSNASGSAGGLLCARRERPRHRSTAEQRDEVAASAYVRADPGRGNLHRQIKVALPISIRRAAAHGAPATRTVNGRRTGTALASFIF